MTVSRYATACTHKHILPAITLWLQMQSKHLGT